MAGGQQLQMRTGWWCPALPPIVVRDELRTGTLIEHCRIPEVREKFYAIVQKRRFPSQLLVGILKEVSDIS